MRPAVPTLSLALLFVLIADRSGALAQVAHHPFAIGANEGAVGRQGSLGAWLLAQESGFYRLLTAAIRATRESTGAMGTLIGLSFGYGVFHAAGPGHGKAVVASYMVSNEVALRRGLVIALLAAILQGFVAVAMVGTAAVVFNATAQRMTAAAGLLELASYFGIVALGAALVWRKGRAFAALLAPAPALSLLGAPTSLAFEATGLRESTRFSVDNGSAAPCHEGACGHVHMPDPRALSAQRFDWRAGAVTVLTAGARPCSGAILVLVFALAQGLFWVGIASTFAMALGTALTTGALAVAAVYAKTLALTLTGGGEARRAIIGRLLELAASIAVLAVGLALVAAALLEQHPL